LNSALLDFFLKSVSTTIRGGFFRYFTQFLERLPIHSIDFSNPKEKATYDHIVQLVESILNLHKRLSASVSSARSDSALRQINFNIREIDRLIYALYGLTENEIEVVEGENKQTEKG
jgi:hypothetical protein